MASDSPLASTIRLWLSVLVLLILTGVAYAPSFENAFLNWDDPVNVTQNRAIREFSAANGKTWFTAPLLGMYSPFVYLSYAVDYAIGGLNPAMYHATNLGLHLGCVLLVFSVARHFTQHRYAAMLAASFFAMHPANVAAVAPISVRSSLLYAVFYLGAYRAYLWHLASPGAARLAVVFVLFAASGLSKSAAVTLPLLMMLTDWYRGRQLSGQSVLEKLPFFALAAAIGGLTLAFRGDVTTGDALQTGWLERGALAAFQLVRYATTSLLPFNLSPFYPYPERVNGSLPTMVWMAPLVLVAIGAIVALVARAEDTRRVVVFGLGFFVLHLSLVLKVVPLGEEFTADRYLYLPLAGLCLAAAELIPRLTRSGPRLAMTAMGIFVLAAFLVLTFMRVADWRDDMSFSSRILEHFPRTATAYSNRAAARLQSGDIDGAIRDSTEAIRIDSSHARAYFNRATAEMLRGRPADAVVDVTRSIALDPDLAASFELRAQARLNTGDLAGARDDAGRAIALAPDGGETFKSYVTRGLARAMLDDGPGALADLDRALALNPAEPGILQNRGQVRINLGDAAGGCADLRQAVAAGREETKPLVTQLCGGSSPPR